MASEFSVAAVEQLLIDIDAQLQAAPSGDSPLTSDRVLKSAAGVVAVSAINADELDDFFLNSYHHGNDALRLEGGIGVFDKPTPTAKATYIADPTDLATCITSITEILTILKDIGFMAES